jgi:hypothetical protein
MAHRCDKFFGTPIKPWNDNCDGKNSEKSEKSKTKKPVKPSNDTCDGRNSENSEKCHYLSLIFV